MSSRTTPFNSQLIMSEGLLSTARILVVDDDFAIRKLHAAILAFEGYEVCTAENGADALEKLSDGHFDLVLTDRQMPVLDGEGMVLALRSAGSCIPVVMVSGSLLHLPLCARVAAEVSATLAKPVDTAEIIAAVFAALHPSSEPLSCAA